MGSVVWLHMIRLEGSEVALKTIGWRLITKQNQRQWVFESDIPGHIVSSQVTVLQFVLFWRGSGQWVTEASLSVS